MGTSLDSAVTKLSRRELEVAGLVAEGLTNREIGQRLFISERTVDGHLEHIREKLGVSSRAQVAAWVVQRGSPAEPAPVATAPTVVRKPMLVAHPRLWIAAALVVALLATGVGLLRLTAPPDPTIDTFAGAQPRSDLRYIGAFSGDGGLARNAQLSRPSDVVAAGDGTVYIADYGNQMIRKVDPRGFISTVAGGRGRQPLTEGAFATDVHLQTPSGLALDPSGALNFLETANGSLEVWKLSDRFTLSRVANLGPSRGTSGMGFRLPTGGLAIDRDGTMYIADPAENHVWKVTPEGDRSIYAGTGVAGFGGDHGAATSAQLFAPLGLALDGRGDLYIADIGNNRIRKVDGRRIITTFAGSSDQYDDAGDGGMATDARLSDPFAIAIGRDGSLYIADTGNSRVRRVTPGGQIEAFAGTGQPGFSGDGGPALQAQFVAPEAITVDGAGNLLIADTANQRIRKVKGPP